MNKYTRHKNTILNSIKKRKKAIIITAIAITLALPTSLPQYIAMTAWCRKLPVIANSFAADYHYYVPGSVSYKIMPFESFYCSAQDAEAAGFSRGL